MTVLITVRTADNPAMVMIDGEEIFVPPLSERDFSLLGDADGTLSIDQLPVGTEDPNPPAPWVDPNAPGGGDG